MDYDSRSMKMVSQLDSSSYYSTFSDVNTTLPPESIQAVGNAFGSLTRQSPEYFQLTDKVVILPDEEFGSDS